jgi:hypothetical protein
MAALGFQNSETYPSITQAVSRARSKEVLEVEECRSEQPCGLAADSTAGL